VVEDSDLLELRYFSSLGYCQLESRMMIESEAMSRDLSIAPEKNLP